MIFGSTSIWNSLTYFWYSSMQLRRHYGANFWNPRDRFWWPGLAHPYAIFIENSNA